MNFKTTLALLLGYLSSLVASAAEPPNIVFIYADDMGYGDVQILNPERGKLPNPHMDRLAREGMIFTDAHTTSSVCTPSRYSLLTGRYNWRTELQKHMLWGYSEPLIAPDRMTVASLLKDHGYHTALIGKWHLGMNMPTIDDGPLPVGRRPKSLNIDWSGQIKNGPTDVGFDHFYGISASLDMAPYIYIQGDRFVGEIPQDGKSSTAKGFDRADVLPEIGRKTAAYIHDKKDSEKPFFVYVPLTSPHTPILPTEEWIGKSGLNKYADFQMQTDHIIGEIIDAVDDAGLKENTLVIVSSDNGCSKAGGIAELQKKGHYPSAQYRGSKADIWEGGHRVPFIARWPDAVEAGSICDQTICMTDLLATCAELVDAELPADAGEDSVSFLPALKGETIETERAGIVHHSISGHFAYRQGDYKLVLSRGSGGWTSPTESQAKKSPYPAQLYQLADDPGEKNNLYKTHPEKAQALLAQLQQDVDRGRSTPGPEQSNDVDTIELWKNGAPETTAKTAEKPHAVIIVGTHHYSPQRSMPLFAQELERLGLATTVVNPDWDPEKDKRGLPGLEALADADIAILFTRFLKLEDEQLGHITRYLESGKPVVGFRTSTHGFNYPKDHPQAKWNNDFGKDALGTPYLIHLAGGTQLELADGAKDHPIFTGIEIPDQWPSPGTLYLTKLEPGITPLLMGTGKSKSAEPSVRTNQFGTHQLQPEMTDTVAWTWTNKWGGKTFSTSLGHTGDFAVPESMRLMVNGVFWAAGQPVPSADTAINPLKLTSPKKKKQPAKAKPAAKPAPKPEPVAAAPATAKPSKLDTGGLTIFYGNSFVERLQEDGTMEAILHAADPSKRHQFRSLAYTGDEVGFRIRPAKFGNHLGYISSQLQCDRVVMCFGMNEAFAGAEGLVNFEKDLRIYIDLIKGRHPGSEYILVSPM